MTVTVAAHAAVAVAASVTPQIGIGRLPSIAFTSIEPHQHKRRQGKLVGLRSGFDRSSSRARYDVSTDSLLMTI
jgi:hypothetical protein